MRQRVRIKGVVQGVGFRPFVYQLATRHHLTGFVSNDSEGVLAEVQGEESALAQFHTDLRSQAPPLAHIEAVLIESIQEIIESGFVIHNSIIHPGTSTSVSPDMAPCADCLRELLDPSDRRYRYPFLNCTNCGPRFTIQQGLPYDRPRTTMAKFALCAACQEEYDDPLNRRFHAQPNACPKCGPKLSYHENGQFLAECEEALALAQRALGAGRIVAIKGIGGFHLACDATNDQAVVLLRHRKRRGDKPFAVLFNSIETIRQVATISEAEERLLLSPQRAIVLLEVRPGTNLSHAIAPGQTQIGALLPYSPLHELLVNETPLVFTSGNVSDEPIIKDNEEAFQRLSSVADAFLVHDRDIHISCDDSVMSVFERREYPIRRSRGYAPLPVALPRELPSVLAVGGELKSTFCLTRERQGYLSQYLGDFGSPQTLAAFERAVAHFESLFLTTPRIVACDAHPGYLSSRWARQFAQNRQLPLLEVQHHHAHLASLMVEKGMDGTAPLLGLCFDGTGYGTDGTIWGGELLLVDYHQCRRLAHLRPVPLPGGDGCIERPYRMALAYLFAAGLDWSDDLPCVRACSPSELRLLRQQLGRNIHCVPTSSIGRLFDAVASLLGVCQHVTYEAQAAIELETLAETRENETYPLPLDPSRGVADPTDLLKSLLTDLQSGVPRERIAGRFHRSLARLIVDLAEFGSSHTNQRCIGLSGGVFLNRKLLQLSVDQLREAGWTVLLHEQVPTNDGGISLGQAVVAGHLGALL